MSATPAIVSSELSEVINRFSFDGPTNWKFGDIPSHFFGFQQVRERSPACTDLRRAAIFAMGPIPDQRGAGAGIAFRAPRLSSRALSSCCDNQGSWTWLNGGVTYTNRMPRSFPGSFASAFISAGWETAQHRLPMMLDLRSRGEYT